MVNATFEKADFPMHEAGRRVRDLLRDDDGIGKFDIRKLLRRNRQGESGLRCDRCHRGICRDTGLMPLAIAPSMCTRGPRDICLLAPASIRLAFRSANGAWTSPRCHGHAPGAPGDGGPTSQIGMTKVSDSLGLFFQALSQWRYRSRDRRYPRRLCAHFLSLACRTRSLCRSAQGRQGTRGRPGRTRAVRARLRL